MKAQFWSFDAVFAIVIFVAIVTVITFVWLGLTDQLSTNTSSTALIMQTQQQTLMSTILTIGSPANWESTISLTNSITWSYVSVGLASAPGSSSLSTDKIMALATFANSNVTDYQASKASLGVSYEYYITIKGSNYNLSIGLNPNTNNALTVYTGTESAIVEGNPALVSVTVWSNQLVGVT
jgi:hypothetical protein